MRATLPLIGFVSVGVVLTTACTQADRALTAPPSRAELVAFPEQEPTLPIVVGVEGTDRGPRLVLVPKFEDIEPTPEERRLLGEVEEVPQPDVLAFYRPPPGPEQGVSSEAFLMSVETGGVGGALVGQALAGRPRVATCGFGGRHAVEHHVVRYEAMVGLPRGRTGYVGRAFSVLVGDGPPRRPAAHSGRVEH